MLKTETLPKTSYMSDNSDCPHLSRSNVQYPKEMQQCLHSSQRQCKPLILFPQILMLESSQGIQSLAWGVNDGGGAGGRE